VCAVMHDVDIRNQVRPQQSNTVKKEGRRKHTPQDRETAQEVREEEKEGGVPLRGYRPPPDHSAIII
jgi:hypothetical protein